MRTDTNGNVLAYIGSYGSSPTNYQSPHGVGVDAAGNIYLTDTSLHKVLVYDHNGNWLFNLATAAMQSPYAVAFDAAGSIFVADPFSANQTFKFDRAGNLLAAFGLPADYSYPSSVGVAPDGRLYVGNLNTGLYIYTPAIGPVSSNTPAGIYPITVASLSDPGNRLANYIVTTNNALLTVTNDLFSIVTTTADSGPGSLRDVLATIPAGFTGHITFAASLAGQTISLTTIGDTNLGGSALLVTTPIIIDATAVPGLVLERASAGSFMRLFRVTSTGGLTLNNLTVQNGLVEMDGTNRAAGGAVYSAGPLFCTNVIFSQNSVVGNGSVAGAGGAIFIGDSTAVLSGCLLTNNVAYGSTGGTGQGGGIFAEDATVSIYSSVLTGNISGTGGNIYASGLTGTASVLLTQSVATNSISLNDVYQSAAPAAFADIELSESTVNSHGRPWIQPLADQTVTGYQLVPFSMLGTAGTTVSATVLSHSSTHAPSITVIGSGTNSLLSITTPSGESGAFVVQIAVTSNNIVMARDITFTIGADQVEAVPDFYTTDQNTSLHALNLLANDTSSIPSDVLGLAGFDTNHTLGHVTYNGDGTFDYKPANLFKALTNGQSDSDYFTYTITNATGLVSSGQVFITLNGLNDPPVASPFTISRYLGTSNITISLGLLLSHIYEADPGVTTSLSAIDSITTAGGTLTQSGQVYIYTPSSATAPDSFTYQATDSRNLIVTNLVSIVITPIPGDGSTQIRMVGDDIMLGFTGVAGGTYTVEYTTDLTNWFTAGPAIEVQPGQFVFRDATPHQLARFYRMRSP